MRTGNVSDADPSHVSEGKTWMEWIWDSMVNWDFSDPTEDGLLTAFKIMSEIKYRYVSIIWLLPTISIYRFLPQKCEHLRGSDPSKLLISGRVPGRTKNFDANWR